MSPADLEQALAKFARVSLCQLPSPLEEWKRLASKWTPGSATRIFAKRDDVIGPAYGGNKSRQLEFLLGDALAKGADLIIHGGAVQSNYCRQLSAAAARLGLDCHLVLSTAYDQPLDQGNHLLDHLFGATVLFVGCPLGAEHEQLKAELRDALIEKGRRPYLITYPQSELLGCVGYLLGALEITQQLESMGLAPPDRVVLPAVGASYAGLLFGLRLLGLRTPVTGFAPLNAEYDIERSIAQAIATVAEKAGLRVPLGTIEDIDIRFDCVGAGYARPSTDGLAALRDVARLEGVLLDPVYTSKAMAGLRSIASPGQQVLFVHTGGSPAIFAYAPEITKFLTMEGR